MSAGALHPPVSPPGELRGALIVARFSLRESLRRRVFVVVGLLTLVFLALYGLATWQAFEAADDFTGPTEAGVEPDVVVGATLAGLAMFAILFLGTILAVFLTLGAVRGDAERGLLQPLLVRPLPRRTLLLGRWLGAAAVCAPYVIVVTLAAFVLTDADRRLVARPHARAAPVARVRGRDHRRALAGGLDRARLDGERDRRVHALRRRADGGPARARSPRRSARTASRTWPGSPRGRCRSRRSTRPAWRDLTADTVGFTRLAIDLGPFGGAQSAGPGLWLCSLAYLALVGSPRSRRSAAATFSPYARPLRRACSRP